MCSLLQTVLKELYQWRPSWLCSLLWREAAADVCQWDKDTATKLAGTAGMSPSIPSKGYWGSGLDAFTVMGTTALAEQKASWQNAYFSQEFSGIYNILHSSCILALLQGILKIIAFAYISIFKLNAFENALRHRCQQTPMYARNSSSWKWLQANCLLRMSLEHHSCPSFFRSSCSRNKPSLCNICSFSVLIY